jgi:hypothetical protein
MSQSLFAVTGLQLTGGVGAATWQDDGHRVQLTATKWRRDDHKSSVCPVSLLASLSIVSGAGET